jgi:hypothetical protein
MKLALQGGHRKWTINGTCFIGNHKMWTKIGDDLRGIENIE